jgi:CheY-like chemotaxis protein
MSTHPPKILVIEDNPADVEILRYGLDKVGEEYALQILRDGEEAMAWVAEHRRGLHGSKPCIIVLDLHLPKYDGIGILREIRRASDLQYIHVILTTTVASPEQKRELATMGAAITSKPNSLPEALAFAHAIMEICKGWSAVQA